jgi:hypothetical protein
LDQEVFGAAKGRVLTVRRRIGYQQGGHEPTGERAQRDVRFDPSEGSADAVVVAAAEAEVLVVLAVRNEAVGVWEAGRTETLKPPSNHIRSASWGFSSTVPIFVPFFEENRRNYASVSRSATLPYPCGKSYVPHDVGPVVVSVRLTRSLLRCLGL